MSETVTPFRCPVCTVELEGADQHGVYPLGDLDCQACAAGLRIVPLGGAYCLTTGAALARVEVR